MEQIKKDIIAVYKKYNVFTGRADRKEYWTFAIFMMAASIVLRILLALPGIFAVLATLLALAFLLASLLPAVAVTIRRLHDIKMSGWLCLLALIPVFGWLALLVLTLLPTKN